MRVTHQRDRSIFFKTCRGPSCYHQNGWCQSLGRSGHTPTATKQRQRTTADAALAALAGLIKTGLWAETSLYRFRSARRTEFIPLEAGSGMNSVLRSNPKTRLLLQEPGFLAAQALAGLNSPSRPGRRVEATRFLRRINRWRRPLPPRRRSAGQRVPALSMRGRRGPDLAAFHQS